LDKPLLECGSVDTLLRQNEEQLQVENLSGKFSKCPKSISRFLDSPYTLCR